MKFDDYLEMSLKLDLGLDDGISGDYQLISMLYEKGTRITVIPDNYQSFLMGDEYKEIILENSFRYYDLLNKNQRIMCSSPAIMYEQYLPYIEAKGNVLLGGLGLGIIPLLMCKKEIVHKVTVVELSSDVIKLCGRENEKLEIINADFYNYLRTQDLSIYDYIYMDAYTSEGNVYADIIIPTRKFLLENYPTIPFDFWEEDEWKINYVLKYKNAQVQ